MCVFLKNYISLFWEQWKVRGHTQQRINDGMVYDPWIQKTNVIPGRLNILTLAGVFLLGSSSNTVEVRLGILATGSRQVVGDCLWNVQLNCRLQSCMTPSNSVLSSRTAYQMSLVLLTAYEPRPMLLANPRMCVPEWTQALGINIF